ncbi:ABC transporter transmembrane domain-containing protein [Terriglobus sp. YAF25]|uniref:ABC transporter transmembrane domain-containing protein n=1 Tax=Terriglobus sp. YAF25 TaxID=3233080 RepID=UPI003F950360
MRRIWRLLLYARPYLLLGTYLVNYAGFGMITDLRNDLYNAVLRRSVAFFQRHTTGTLLSTLINDIEKVQVAMSSVLSELLQQFFTLLWTAVVVVLMGGRLSWVLLLFVPVVISSARRIGRSVRSSTRKGQDKLAEIQNILHETITGNRIVKAFGMELWEMNRFRKAARRLFRANLKPDHSSHFWWPYSRCMTRSASSPCSTTASSKPSAPVMRSSGSWTRRMM